ncbi:hypothetical protein ACLB1Q_27025 [Escherichia coli]
MKRDTKREAAGNMLNASGTSREGSDDERIDAAIAATRIFLSN